MELLIKFLRRTYPTVIRDKIQTSLIIEGQEYCTISVAKNGTLNFMDKFIYESSKGSYIRVLTRPNRYMRVYMHEFKEEK